MKLRKSSDNGKKRTDLDEKCSNNFVRGAVAAIIALVLYVALPLAIQDAIIPMIPEGVDAEGIKALLKRWLIAGIPLVIVSFPAKYYGLGTGKRFAFTTVRIVLKIVWMLYTINFGDLNGIVSVEIDGSMFTADLLVKGFAALLTLPLILKIVVAYCDYSEYKGIAASLCPEDTTRDDGIRVKGRFS